MNIFRTTVLTLCQWKEDFGGKIVLEHFYTKSNIGLERPGQANLNVSIHII